MNFDAAVPHHLTGIPFFLKKNIFFFILFIYLFGFLFAFPNDDIKKKKDYKNKTVHIQPSGVAFSTAKVQKTVFTLHKTDFYLFIFVWFPMEMELNRLSHMYVSISRYPFPIKLFLKILHSYKFQENNSKEKHPKELNYIIKPENPCGR